MGVKMKVKAMVVLVMVLMVAIMINAKAMAGESGRYKALLVTEGNSSTLPKVFIVDTQEGHLWTWSQSYTKVTQQGGEIGTFLEYQGKLRPGQKMGDQIEMKAKW